jgi:tetratricopeptide (TPR) repeat protein
VLPSRYRYLRDLQRDDRGLVYLAFDVAEEREVLIKQLLRGGGEARTRFQREARALSRLRHPGIAQIYDYNLSAPQPYLVMEYVPGEPLSQLTPSPAEALAIFANVAEVLSVVHSRGIVHRNLKPSNILVTPLGEVKITDFGLASLDDDRPLWGERSAYAAPELQGRRSDARSDLYALGVMLHEYLTGELPFRPDFTLKAMPLLRLRDRVPSAPPELDALVANLLATDPAARPRFSHQVAAVLRACAQHDADVLIRVRRYPPNEFHEPLPGTWLEPPLVGYDVPLNAVREALGRAREGQARLLLVRGEAGLGMSKVIEELLAMAQPQGFSWCYGSTSQTVRVPLAPLVQALSKCSPDWPLDYDPLRGLLPEPASPLVALPAEEALYAQRQRLFVACLELVRRCSAELPIMMVIDQLQWCDEASLLLLRHLLANLQQAPLLFIFTIDPHATASDHNVADLWRSFPAERIITLDLHPLSLAETQAFLAAGLGDAGVAEQLAPTLHRESGGYPLILEQLVQTMLAEGALRWQGDAWQVVAATPPAITPDLGQALARRLALFSPEARELLALAAVIGPTFPYAVLRRVVSYPEELLLDEVRGLVQAGLLAEDAVASDCLTLPSRTLARFVISQLSKRRLRSYHRRALAAWQVVEGTEAERLLSHAEGAEDWEAVIRYASLAAERALGRTAMQSASQLLASALAACRYIDVPAAQRGELLLRRLQLLQRLGRWEEYWACHAELSALIDRLPAEQVLAYWAEVGQQAWNEGEYGRAKEAFNRVLAGSSAPSAVRVRALCSLSAVCSVSGQPQEALDLVQQALTEAHALGDPVALFDAYLQRFNTRDIDERYEVSRQEIESALHYARESRDPALLAMALDSLATLELRTGDFAAALATLTRAVQHATQSGFRSIEGFARANLGYALISLGRLAQAREELERAHAISEALGNHRLSAYALAFKLVERYFANDPEGVLRASQGLTERHRAASPGFYALALAVKSQALLALEKPEAGLEVASQAFATVPTQSMDTIITAVRAAHILALAANDRHGEAIAQAELAGVEIQRQAEQLADPLLRKRFLAVYYNRVVLDYLQRQRR